MLSIGNWAMVGYQKFGVGPDAIDFPGSNGIGARWCS